jgi:hypothetical protein
MFFSWITKEQVKKLAKAQKQLNEFKMDFNKHWNKTKKIINKKEINQIKKAVDMKEDLNKDMESPFPPKKRIKQKPWKQKFP